MLMEKDIGKLQKDDQTDIVLKIDDFGGRRGFTIREFVTSDKYTGFTKAGVRILAKDFPKFKEMVGSIADEDMKEEEVEQKTLDEAPAEEAPKEEAPKEEAPAEETPAEEAPKEEAPKEEAPAEELPDY